LCTLGGSARDPEPPLSSAWCPREMVLASLGPGRQHRHRRRASLEDFCQRSTCPVGSTSIRWVPGIVVTGGSEQASPSIPTAPLWRLMTPEAPVFGTLQQGAVTVKMVFSGELHDLHGLLLRPATGGAASMTSYADLGGSGPNRSTYRPAGRWNRRWRVRPSNTSAKSCEQCHRSGGAASCC
jgi:hypothetical protein